ncbi:MAG: RNA polymerase sigma factor [Acidobacteriota bacterium]
MEGVAELHPAPAEAGEPGRGEVRGAGVDDRLLVRRAQAGDLAAFEALYRAHIGRIHALCLRLSGQASLAEELTQEVFIRAWQRLASFRGESSFGTWAHRMAVNIFLDDRRSRAVRDQAGHLDDAGAPEPRARPRDPASGLDLERAIAALPAGARTVFVLHDVEGWEHGEIAALVGIAVGTAKAQLHRARRLLREVLEP